MKVSNIEMSIYLQGKLHRHIEKFGETDARTVKVSQRLDKYKVIEQINVMRRSNCYEN